jgi:RimJ/RimL family protein N-acetyltransferase
MISKAALSHQATLFTPRLRLEQMGGQHLERVLESINDPESRRLTGTHRIFDAETVSAFLARLPGADDRADWAVIRLSDEAFLGEVVLNDLDEDNRVMNFRIALSNALGEGYGTEATRAVVEYGLEVVGLHRMSLSVYAFNPRARRVYEKCGFVHEGVDRDALLWDGEWFDSLRMSVLATDPRSNDAISRAVKPP